MSWQVKVAMEPTLAAVRQAAGVFKAAVGDLGTPDVRQELELAFVEACTNSAVHGSNTSSSSTIRVTLEIESSNIEIVIEDDGKPFDPFKKDREINFDDISSLPCGGFGLSLIRRICDSVDYEHTGQGNRLTLRKSVNDPRATRVATSAR